MCSLWQPLGRVFDDAKLQAVVLDRIPRENIVDGRRFIQVAWPALRKPIFLIIAATVGVLLLQIAFRGSLL